MTTLAGREEVPLDSIPLYNIANHLFYIVYPLIILLGTFGSVMIIIIMHMQFVLDTFVYIEIAIYSVIPFAFLVLGNSILVWKLSASMKEARSNLSKGNTKQILAREKVASSVTLTVIVVSVTFIILTLPVSVNYILSYFDREYNQVTGYEYAKAHMFYTISILLADSNSAVNFYLYCLTGKRFREEFFRTICCGRVRQSSDRSSVPKAMSAQSA
ncbi:hypothetical protein ACOMHN_045757 [Nucella lapillus]